MKKYLSINQIDAYVIAFKLSNQVWEIVIKWDKLAQWTIGKQFINAADSISANIAEGFGRFHKKEKIHFYRYSYGSMEEAKDWTRKAIKRNLLNQEEQKILLTAFEELPRLINQLIKYTDEKLKY